MQSEDVNGAVQKVLGGWLNMEEQSAPAFRTTVNDWSIHQVMEAAGSLSWFKALCADEIACSRTLHNMKGPTKLLHTSHPAVSSTAHNNVFKFKSIITHIILGHSSISSGQSCRSSS